MTAKKRMREISRFAVHGPNDTGYQIIRYRWEILAESAGQSPEWIHDVDEFRTATGWAAQPTDRGKDKLDEFEILTPFGSVIARR